MAGKKKKKKVTKKKVTKKKVTKKKVAKTARSESSALDPATILSELNSLGTSLEARDRSFMRAFFEPDADGSPGDRVAGVRLYVLRAIPGVEPPPSDPSNPYAYRLLEWELHYTAVVVGARGDVTIQDYPSGSYSHALELPKRLPPKTVTLPNGRVVTVKPEWLEGKDRPERVFHLVRQLLKDHADDIYSPFAKLDGTVRGQYQQLVAVIDDPELLNLEGGERTEETRDWPLIAEVVAQGDPERWTPSRSAAARWERKHAKLFAAAKQRARARRAELKRLLKRAEGAQRDRHFIGPDGEYFAIKLDVKNGFLSTSTQAGEPLFHTLYPGTGPVFRNETVQLYLSEIEDLLEAGYEEVSASKVKALVRKRKAEEKAALQAEKERASSSTQKRSSWREVLVDGPWGSYRWGEPAENAAIAAIKTELGLAVPKDLVAFLKAHESVEDEQGFSLVANPDKIIEATLEVRGNYADWDDAEVEGLLVFNDDWLGNGDLYGYQRGAIVRFDHETGETETIAKDLTELLEQQLQEAAKAG